MRRTLSPREREVVQLATMGHNVREMAMLLGISPHTIRNHLRTIYLKWNVADRVHLIGAALERGVVSPESLMAPHREAIPNPPTPPEPVDAATEVYLPLPTQIRRNLRPERR